MTSAQPDPPNTTADITTLIAQLGDADGEMARRAAYQLGQLGPAASEAVPALIEAMDGRQQELRWYAVDALGHIGPDAAASVPAILAAIRDRDNDASFRRAAAATLGRIGPPARSAVPLLAAALKAADPVLRVEAALALCRIDQSEQSRPVIVETLATTGPEGPFEAVSALAQMDDQATTALPALVAALAHPQVDVRRAAADLIGGMGLPAAEPVARAVHTSSTIDRRAAAVALGRIGDDTRRTIVYNRQLDPEQAATAAQPLVRIVVPTLGRLLADDDESVRTAAASALARAGIVAAPTMLAALRHPSQEVRTIAVWGLTQMENYLPPEDPPPAGVVTIRRNLVEPLIEVMRHDDVALRRAAFRLFAAMPMGPPGQAAAPTLREGLRDQDAAIRRYAARSLEQLEPSRQGTTQE